MAKRERGEGRVYQRPDPKNPKRLLKVWWIDYHVVFLRVIRLFVVSGG